jgi:hypothetical protein
METTVDLRPVFVDVFGKHVRHLPTNDSSSQIAGLLSRRGKTNPVAEGEVVYLQQLWERTCSRSEPRGPVTTEELTSTLPGPSQTSMAQKGPWEDELLDWDTRFEVPPPKRIRKFKARIRFVGRSQPSRFIEDWD